MTLSKEEKEIVTIALKVFKEESEDLMATKQSQRTKDFLKQNIEVCTALLNKIKK